MTIDGDIIEKPSSREHAVQILTRYAGQNKASHILLLKEVFLVPVFMLMFPFSKLCSK